MLAAAASLSLQHILRRRAECHQPACNAAAVAAIEGGIGFKASLLFVAQCYCGQLVYHL